MNWLLLFFFCVCLIGLKFNFKTGFNDYLGKTQTNAIRGIFAIIIFFSHFTTYISLGTYFGDNIYLKIISTIGQLMVAPFFFYSGYGIYCSAQKKRDYIKTFPKHRLLKTLIFFDLAVIPFLIIALFKNTGYSIWHILLSFTGWTSLGNSNWFMFAILVLYVFVYIAALLTRRKIDIRTIAIITLFSFIYIVIVNHFKQGATYWTDTILCFPAGMFIAHHKAKFDSALKNKYLLCLFISIAASSILYYIKGHAATSIPYIVFYNLLSISFCIVLTIFTNRIRISNYILQFLGTYGFEIYILQRIPDMILQPVFETKHIIFFITSLAFTIFISLIFKRVANKITSKLESKKPKKALSL